MVDKGRLQNDVFMIDLRDFPKRPLALPSLRSSRSESLFFCHDIDSLKAFGQGT